MPALSILFLSKVLNTVNVTFDVTWVQYQDLLYLGDSKFYIYALNLFHCHFHFVENAQKYVFTVQSHSNFGLTGPF